MERNEALKAAWHDNTVRAHGDDALTLLAQSYRHYRQIGAGKAYPASEAIKAARKDVATGKRRYPHGVAPAVTWQAVSAAPRETMGYVETLGNAGLREVGRVMPECGGRNGYWDMRGDCGWHTYPGGESYKDGSGLCYGVVFQLPGRNGKARFVAGYQFGGVDGGPMVDLSRVYEGERDDYAFNGDVLDNAAACEAARAADGMAERAAEEEREYQTAWQAGSRYADLKRETHDNRAEAVALLRERRAARSAGLAGYDSICAVIRSRVAEICRFIASSREDMRQLAEGDYYSRHISYGWNTREKRLREAFNEGAGEVIFR